MFDKVWIHFKIHVVILLFLLSHGATFALSAGGIPVDRLEHEIDTYIFPLVSDNKFSGSILIAKGEVILFSKGYGYANREYNILNSPNTVYRIGSMTKQFTATAIMQLIEKDKLRLEDKLSQFIDDYPQGEKITIHHLLTHTSGISNFTRFDSYIRLMTVPVTITELIERFKNKPIEFEPGSQFKYTDSGYILLTYIIEKISGLSYAKYIDENIFEPLKMMNTGYDYNDLILKNRANGYIKSPNNEMQNAPYIDMSIPQGAGGLYSTTLDLYKWDRGLFTDMILTSKYRQKMFTPHVADYGYGWGFEKRKDGRRSIGHNGVINGFSSVIHRFTEDDVVIIVLSNIESSTANQVFHEIPSIYFNEND